MAPAGPRSAYADFEPSTWSRDHLLNVLRFQQGTDRQRQYLDVLGRPALRACTCSPSSEENDFKERMREFNLYEIGGSLPLMQYVCPKFTEKYELCAFIGGGSYGQVWLVRLRDKTAGKKVEHFAAKFQVINTAVGDQLQKADIEVDGDSRRVLFEPFINACLSHPDSRIPALLEVYDHGDMHILVGELFGTPPPPHPSTTEEFTLSRWTYGEMSPRGGQLRPLPKFPSVTGYDIYEMYSELPEDCRCRIGQNLTQALHNMFEKGFTHGDFAPQNYLVNESCKAKVVDFGFGLLHPKPRDFFIKGSSFASIDDIPEAIAAREKGEYPLTDLRQVDLWRLAIVIYLLLQRARPREVGRGMEGWETGSDNNLRQAAAHAKLVRFQAEPVLTQESLSQDAQDVLQVMLQVEPTQRPSMPELITFPWFSGWTEDSGEDFTIQMPPFRPEGKPRRNNEPIPGSPTEKLDLPSRLGSSWRPRPAEEREEASSNNASEREVAQRSASRDDSTAAEFGTESLGATASDVPSAAAEANIGSGGSGHRSEQQPRRSPRQKRARDDGQPTASTEREGTPTKRSRTSQRTPKRSV